MTTRRPGGRPRRAVKRRDVLGDRATDLLGDRPALQESRPPDSLDQASTCGAIGSRGSSLADVLARLGGVALDLVRAAGRPARSSRRPTSASPTDGRLIRTLAAAPRAAASPRSAATLRSLDGVDVAPPGQRLRDRDELDAGLDAAERHLGRRRARPSGAPPFGLAVLVLGVPGQLHRRGEPGVGRRSPRRRAPGTGPPARCPDLVRPGEEVGVLGVLRAALGQGGDHRHEARAPRPAATAEALPPPGHRLRPIRARR